MARKRSYPRCGRFTIRSLVDLHIVTMRQVVLHLTILHNLTIHKNGYACTFNYCYCHKKSLGYLKTA